MSRRKLFPLPVWSLIDDPEFLTLTSAAVGMLTRIVLHYWQTECRPLPSADGELYSIARAHRPTWRRQREAVMRIFGAIEPDLKAYHALRESKGTALSRLAQRTHSRRRAAALHNFAPSLEPIPAYAMGFVPKREQAPPRKPREADPAPARRPMIDRG